MRNSSEGTQVVTKCYNLNSAAAAFLCYTARITKENVMFEVVVLVNLLIISAPILIMGAALLLAGEW